MTDDTPKIPPVLDAEEWADILSDDMAEFHFPPAGFALPDDTLMLIGDNWVDAKRVIARANHALPADDPRKITRETIAALDWVLDTAGDSGDYLHSVRDKLEPIRNALASYLPPDTP